ncbi:Putative sterigmatocystin biosynthesis lipase/esterase stcI [Cytospora mali]|uniref:Sterigmatocystin biosynthesis lipase/esterase stcI n=1 Tax=Cytospora mali TaxID=578113 RepID=A0A194V1D2_CYTMA|nr:Putative sterigmatocystin biosynthesis lipase/esterase stcI [Valsa mali var. pyri (nom. inval.)]
MEDEAPILQKAPALDPAWLQYEKEASLLAPKPAIDPLQKQKLYAAQCRELNGAMMAVGARDHHLSQGIETQYVSVPSSLDGYAIPVLQYDRAVDPGGEPSWVVVYYHGGALFIGEADSEDLSCRRIVRESHLPSVRLYSVGYRLKPLHPVSTIVQDSMDAFDSIIRAHPTSRILVVGSSSGGELAALVTQHAAKGSFHGVVLRCPVTSDAFSGAEYVPERLRALHTSAWERSFESSILGFMERDVPRDGLEKMPLEISAEDLNGMPRTWVQVCTNDVLYSDGVCYARVLRDAGVEVKMDIVWGWPHTFWLKAPHLPRALEADKAMLDGITWVAGLDE